MDPDACYRSILAAVKDRDFELADALMRDMLSWLNRGGFYPKGMGLASMTRLRVDIAMGLLKTPCR